MLCVSLEDINTLSPILLRICCVSAVKSRWFGAMLKQHYITLLLYECRVGVSFYHLHCVTSFLGTEATANPGLHKVGLLGAKIASMCEYLRDTQR